MNHFWNRLSSIFIPSNSFKEFIISSRDTSSWNTTETVWECPTTTGTLTVDGKILISTFIIFSVSFDIVDITSMSYIMANTVPANY